MGKDSDKLLGKVFDEVRMEHLLNGDYHMPKCNKDKIHPALDHYNTEMNKKLGKKLFKQ